MTNNDIMRRIRFIFDMGDSKMIAIFAQAEFTVTREQISQWLKKEEDADYQQCNDKHLAIFLNGFINEKRGKQDGEQPKPEKRLTNNIIFRKLKIALNMKDVDILEVLALADFNVSKHELSAFFRKATHQHFRDCKDQVLRRFLQGLQYKHRPDTKSEFSSDTKTETRSAAKPKTQSASEPKAKSNTGFVWNELKD